MTYYITSTGRKIDLLNISEDDICLQDISHHLSKICRYGGALNLNLHYSVANHSMALYHYAVDNCLSVDIQRALLMHDATEAYLGDIVAGLKQLLPDYRRIEYWLAAKIESKYSCYCSVEDQSIVKELDTRILLDEAKAFVPTHYKAFKDQSEGLEPLGIKLYPERDLHITKAMFLHCCEQLGIKD